MLRVRGGEVSRDERLSASERSFGSAAEVVGGLDADSLRALDERVETAATSVPRCEREP